MPVLKVRSRSMNGVNATGERRAEIEIVSRTASKFSEAWSIAQAPNRDGEPETR